MSNKKDGRKKGSARFQENLTPGRDGPYEAKLYEFSDGSSPMALCPGLSLGQSRGLETPFMTNDFAGEMPSRKNCFDFRCAKAGTIRPEAIAAAWRHCGYETAKSPEAVVTLNV